MQKTFYCLKATKDGKDFFISAEIDGQSFINPQIEENFSKAILSENLSFLDFAKTLSISISKIIILIYFPLRLSSPNSAL